MTTVVGQRTGCVAARAPAAEDFVAEDHPPADDYRPGRCL